ncbi:MAG: response regulator [Lachnospiraceae bacterium]|nr:response regulator [Lachnospiraceae bacterium]
MTGLYLTQIEATAFFFDLALCVYLLWVRRRSDSVRASYLQFLLLVTAAIFLDVIQAVLMNLNRTSGLSHFPLTIVFSAVQVLELLAAAFFTRYAMDQADANEKAVRTVSRILQVFSLIYAAIQVINLFTHVSHVIDAEGVVTRGPLYIPVNYVYPLVYLSFGCLTFLSLRRRYTKSKAVAIFAGWLFTVGGILFQVLIAPQVLTALFGASVASFLLYFALETPPFIELKNRLREVEEAGIRAEAEKERALTEDRGMNEFLANMSHEIRTPLTAILGYNEVILNHADEEDVREYAQDIRNAGNTLLYIVGDILDFSKIESGDLMLSVGNYRLHDVLDNLGNMIRKKARDKGLEYRTDIDESIPDELIGDGIRVNQILLNLLNNAVKYTEHGYVQLKMRAGKGKEDGVVVLEAAVEDSGIGIRDADMDKLFNAFARFDEEKNTGVEGTGLGLAITSKLLRLMDGTIDVKSTYGKGSVFHVSIPQKVIGTDTIGTVESNGDVSSATGKELLLAPDARMLVVDDNLTNRTVVGELLSQTLIRIDMAESGEACLNAVSGQAYDVILMDQMMPHLSGPQTLEKMREMGEANRSRNARVVAFTADAIAGTKERLLALGFDAYLSKPVTIHTLTQMLYAMLPAEKILKPGMEGYGEALDTSRKHLKSETQKSNEQMILEQLQGIDLAQALAICGTKDVLLAAVRDFYNTIQEQADLIAQYEASGDINNYTIKVHALKSAANFIGARKLSDDAAYLERMGNKKNADEIREKTPALLMLYRSYLEKLSAIDPDRSPEADEREEITEEDLLDAYGEIRLFAEDYDFDGIDAMMETLSEYRIPQNQQARFKQIRTCVTNVDREGLLKLL